MMKCENPYVPIPESDPVSLMKAKPHQCRWPVGENPFRFCGADAVVKSSYCEAHKLRSRGAGTPSERIAHKVVLA